MQQREWLDPPDDGTQVCGGFDGSVNDDWTAIRLETRDGYQFTPRWPDGEPMVWDPHQHGDRIPRDRVLDAWGLIAERWRLVRVYCDPGFNDPTEPTSWASEIESWAETFGEDVFISWQMSGNVRQRAVHAALLRFHTDVTTRALTHDGCPLTAIHIGNARRIAKPGDRYVLGKPAQTQKIDIAVTSVLAHEATCDARAAGWPEQVDSRMFCFR